jgi:hypothetical protein
MSFFESLTLSTHSPLWDEVLNIKKVLKDQNWSFNPICNRLG